MPSTTTVATSLDDMARETLDKKPTASTAQQNEQTATTSVSEGSTTSTITQSSLVFSLGTGLSIECLPEPVQLNTLAESIVDSAVQTKDASVSLVLDQAERLRNNLTSVSESMRSTTDYVSSTVADSVRSTTAKVIACGDSAKETCSNAAPPIPNMLKPYMETANEKIQPILCSAQKLQKGTASIVQRTTEQTISAARHLAEKSRHIVFITTATALKSVSCVGTKSLALLKTSSAGAGQTLSAADVYVHIRFLKLNLWNREVVVPFLAPTERSQADVAEYFEWLNERQGLIATKVSHYIATHDAKLTKAICSGIASAFCSDAIQELEDCRSTFVALQEGSRIVYVNVKSKAKEVLEVLALHDRMQMVVRMTHDQFEALRTNSHMQDLLQSRVATVCSERAVAVWTGITIAKSAALSQVHQGREKVRALLDSIFAHQIFIRLRRLMESLRQAGISKRVQDFALYGKVDEVLQVMRKLSTEDLQNYAKYFFETSMSQYISHLVRTTETIRTSCTRYYRQSRLQPVVWQTIVAMNNKFNLKDRIDMIRQHETTITSEITKYTPSVATRPVKVILSSSFEILDLVQSGLCEVADNEQQDREVAVDKATILNPSGECSKACISTTSCKDNID